MRNCYLCGTGLESYVDSESKNHYEHIIPQGLGGQLDLAGILCKECGGDKFLGGKIDKPFCNIFSLITERLDIKNDRKTKPVSLEGKYHFLGENNCIDIYLRDGNISPKIPDKKFDHDRKVAYVYANKKVAKHFKTHVENELKKEVSNYSVYTTEIVSSLNDYRGILELPFNLDNDILKKGLTKIAIEFALSKGIKYETIKHLIDRSKRTIKCNNNVVPYFPIAKTEEMMEYIRTSIDSNFMSHSLVLFSQRQIDNTGKEVKQLYCFIELFGTFQYFVELSSNYIGADIEQESYAQRILKAQKSNFKIQGLDYKDLFICLKDLGLDDKDVEGLNYNEICAKLQSRYDKKNNYIFDYSENTKRIVESMIQYAILKSDKELISVIHELQSHFYFNMGQNNFHITFFRSRFMKDSSPYSLIPAIKELYVEDKDRLTRYTYFKFKELSVFIDENKSA